MKIILSHKEACDFIKERYSGAMVELVEDGHASDTRNENQRMIDFLEVVKSVLLGNNKITFIRLFRASFNSGLAEAKNAIEQPEFAIEKLKSGLELKFIKFPPR